MIMMKMMMNMNPQNTQKKFLCKDRLQQHLQGPPATSQVANDPMEEYQKQLEEYNRKMAEYQAWQHAQGSQATDDTTIHE